MLRIKRLLCFELLAGLLKLPFDQRLVRFGFGQVLASFFNLLAQSLAFVA